MDQTRLSELLNELPPGILCTTEQGGQVNAAVFGSVRLLNDGRLILGLGDNRTLKNLRQNPQACYIAYAPGKTILDSKGIRLYLELEALEEQGELFDATIAEIETVAGKYAARQTRCVALFRIGEIRPLLDLKSPQP